MNHLDVEPRQDRRKLSGCINFASDCYTGRLIVFFEFERLLGPNVWTNEMSSMVWRGRRSLAHIDVAEEVLSLVGFCRVQFLESGSEKSLVSYDWVVSIQIRCLLVRFGGLPAFA